jgi:hypothetical protein
VLQVTPWGTSKLERVTMRLDNDLDPFSMSQLRRSIRRSNTNLMVTLSLLTQVIVGALAGQCRGCARQGQGITFVEQEEQRDVLRASWNW